MQDMGGEEGTVEQFLEATKQQLQGVINDFKVVEEESQTLDSGEKAYLLAYTGSQGDFKFKWQQVLTIIDGKAIVATYTAEEDKFDKFYDIAGQIIDSWTVL
jgi:hypothetical protein